MRLFDRRCGVIVSQPADTFGEGGARVLEFSQLRVTFSVVKTLAVHPNTCKFKIYNLAETSRAAVRRDARVVLQAGYADGIEQLAVGDIRHALHTHPSVDWISEVEMGDGERAFNHAVIADSFAGRVGAGRVLERIAKATGLGLGNVPQVVAELNRTAQYDHGIVLRGRAARCMDEVLAAWGYSWSVQDGQIQVVKTGFALSEAIILSPTTGLIGSPENLAGKRRGAAEGKKLRSLLNPKIRPGVRLDVQSAGTNGLFRVEKVDHNGDTAGGPWYSDIEATPTT